MELVLATAADAPRVMEIMDACKAMPCTIWDDNYPTLDIVQEDIAASALYCLWDEGALLGALSVEDAQETEALGCFTKTKNPCELCRVCIAPHAQGKGLAQTMVSLALKRFKEQGYTAVRLLVGKQIHAARAVYLKCGFVIVGERLMREWGNTVYDLMEIML